MRELLAEHIDLRGMSCSETRCYQQNFPRFEHCLCESGGNWQNA